MPRLSQNPENLAPFIITPRANTQARRVQTANSGTDRPNDVVREIGNETLVGAVFGDPNVTGNIEANLVNTNLLAIIANRNPATTFTDLSVNDLLGAREIDINMVQRNALRTAWLQSVYIRQAAIGGYRITASVDGNATENFDFTANNKTAFERPVTVDNLVATAPGQTAYTLTQTPAALTRGADAGKMLKSASYSQANGNSVYLEEGVGKDYTVTGTTVTISAAVAAEVIVGTQFAFAYQRATGGTTPDPYQSKDTTSPAAIRGYYHIPLTITIGATNLAPTGVQGINVGVDFGVALERGMGNQVIGALRNSPPPITGDFTVFEERFDIEKLLIAGVTNSANTDYPIDAFRDDIELRLDFKHPSTGTILRTDRITGVTIVGEGRDVTVGNAVGKRFNFSAVTNGSWLVSKPVQEI